MSSIESAVLDLFHAVDVLDWDGVRAALDEQVALDYTSLFGGEPATVTRDQVIASWQGILPGFDATQHLLGPLRINERENEALVETHVRGYHRLETATWMVAGHYHITMRLRETRWHVAAIRLDTYYQDGAMDLVEKAQARAKTNPRASRAH